MPGHGDRAVFALLSPPRTRHKHRLAQLSQGWEVPQWRQEPSPRVAGDHWLPPSPPCVTAGPRGDMLSLDQALNSAGHSRGTNASCISSPCWGTPVRLSQAWAAQPTAQPRSARRAPPVPSPMLGMSPCCGKGSRSIHPFAAAVTSTGAWWDAGDAQLRGGLPQLPTSAPLPPHPLQAHRQHRGIPGAGFTGLIQGWHHHPAPAPGAKWEPGSSPHAWPSLEAQT